METNFNNANVDALLKIAAAKLNMKPDVLKKQLESGNVQAAMKNMSPKDAARFQKALKNPGMVKEMMSASQAKDIYKKITGKDPV
jgi:hypothetical protein